MIKVMPVPKPLWHRNANRKLGREWERIRRDVFREQGPDCRACLSTPKELECDEEWMYDDHRNCARLVGFRMLCKPCHAAKHFLRSEREGLGPDCLRHIARVNKWDKVTTLEHVQAEMRLWNERSRSKWTVEVEASLVERYPALEKLATDFPSKQGSLFSQE